MDDLDLQNFANVTRLFPLPKVVLFPHVVLPLHVFEPRYRQMTEDALASDQLITIVQIKTHSESEGWTEPAPIEDVGCLGQIIRHQKLADGRFNVLLLGRKRVRLREEPTSDKLYRVAEADLLHDLDPEQPEEPRRIALIDLFRRVVGREHTLDPDLSKLLDARIPLGVVVDVMAHSLSLPTGLKQALLSEPSIEKRCATIQERLEQIERIAGSIPRRLPFPPDFSPN